MINNISHVDNVVKQAVLVRNSSQTILATPPILSFKTSILKEKATIKIKKIKRGDNLVMVGDIDDDYVDIVEEVCQSTNQNVYNFFKEEVVKRKLKYLKNCYLIDDIQSPKMSCGLGTEAIKNLAEKALFDPKANGRIVTFSAPVCRESSPAQFFYKLGFRFMQKDANERMEYCIMNKIPDLPPQTGMMYLPRANLHKLLRYGDVF